MIVKQLNLITFFTFSVLFLRSTVIDSLPWLCSCFWWFRASDKKRNLAQQKAEAQRRLYGHGSVKKLSASSSDREKQRHTLERRREELVNPKRTTQMCVRWFTVYMKSVSNWHLYSSQVNLGTNIFAS